MRKIGYERVSSASQNLSRQDEVLKEKCDTVFSEKQSGKDIKNRPVLKSLIETILVEGDTLIVYSLDRLSRSISDLLNILDKLQEKGIHFISIKENIYLKDKMDAYSKFFFIMLGALAEMERSLIKERQKEGIRINRIQNKPYGRKKTPQNILNAAYEFYITQTTESKLNVGQVAKNYGISRATLYNEIKKRKTEK